MRFRWLMLAAFLGTGMINSTAYALSNTDYQQLRNNTAITTLVDTNNLTDQFIGRTGQTVEIEGVVSGVISSNGNSAFLLRLESLQTLVVTYHEDDPEIAVGNSVRVLTRVPDRGTNLELVGVTNADSVQMAQQNLANLQGDETGIFSPPVTGIEIIPDTPTSMVRYYTAPTWQPQPDRSKPSQVVAQDQPMAKQEWIVKLYSQRIQQVNDAIDDTTARKIATQLLDKSEQYRVDPRLVFALVTQESRFNPHAVSPVGAQGLGQLMPGTAAGLGVHNPFDIDDNLDGTIRYISSQLNSFGNLSLALAAYNAGPGNVRKYGGVPPFHETQNYVKSIWNHYARLAGLDPATGQQIASR